MFFQSIETVDSGTYLEGPPENAKVSWLLRRSSRYGALGGENFERAHVTQIHQLSARVLQRGSELVPAFV